VSPGPSAPSCTRGGVPPPLRVTFLGTAGSWPTKDRSASAIAVDLERELVLLDCGEGTQRQFFQSSEPLDIYGPPDAEEMVGRALSMGYFTLRFPVTVHPMQPGESVDLDGYSVRTSLAAHPVPSVAYRIEEAPRRGKFDAAKARSLGIRGPDFGKLEAGTPVHVGASIVHPADVMGAPRPGRSLVYSGDTGPSDDVRRLAHRATVLIHEATVAQDIEAEANEWGHSSARQAAELARSAEAKALFLTHFSSRYKELEPLESEARVIFPGSRAARDLLDELVHYP